MSGSQITPQVADLVAASTNGGLPEHEWRRLAAKLDVDADQMLADRILVREFEGDVLSTAAGREALASHRAVQPATDQATTARRTGPRVAVTDHAVERALQRHSSGRSWDEMRRTIRREVAEAISAGRIANDKPRWWPLLYGQRRRARQLPIGQRFVWNESRSRAFVVARESDGEHVVLTCLHRVASPPDEDAPRHAIAS